jgi:hypothetical protein
MSAAADGEYKLRTEPGINSIDWPQTLSACEFATHRIIPLSEAHLRHMLKAWVTHYSRGRPHAALGPGVPDPPASLAVLLSSSRHRLDDFRSVHAKAILGGLHHEYSLARA